MEKKLNNPLKKVPGEKLDYPMKCVCACTFLFSAFVNTPTYDVGLTSLPHTLQSNINLTIYSH